MSRYIDAELLEPDTEWDFYEECYISYSQINIDTAETADVVEVVRCKDCIYWRDSDHTCKHSFTSPKCANDYCSKGERKDD